MFIEFTCDDDDLKEIQSVVHSEELPSGTARRSIQLPAVAMNICSSASISSRRMPSRISR